MKMVKSLLLGGAAGLAAVAGAQAADLPVKAKPVEYVKVCSLYGEGFFYIPGTDTCIKIGGWVRYDQYFNATGSGDPLITAGGGRNDSFDSPDYFTRARTVVSFDVRTQTEYGTLRSYYRGGFELTSNFVSQGAYYTERAFVQFAGFTFGKTQSYFDTWAQAWSYAHGFLGAGANTAAAGRNLMAYTATLGNGVSWTIAAEDTTSRRGALWDAGTNGLSIGSFPGPNTWNGVGYPTCGFGSVTSDQNIANTASPLSVSGACATGDYAAQQVPDIVSSLRVDQAWGSAQISGALHQVRGNFYGNDVQATITQGPTAFTGVRPGDAWGWAVAGGIVVNLPWNPGDKFWIEGAVGEGTPCYVGICQDGVNGNFTRFDGHNVANGWGLDGVFANAVGNGQNSPAAGGTSNFTGIQLPTVWDVAAAVEHYWTPALRTSLFGSVTSWDPGSSGNAIMCNSPNAPTRGIAGQTGAPGVPTPANYGTNPISGGAIAGCNYAFELFAVGTRTVWNPVKNLDIGVEVMWSQIHQNMDPSKIALNFGGGGNRAAGFYSPSDENVVSGMFRVQRNFWP
ncbi:MAG: porin [Hyphomicrobiales bacterium]|nr:porin [Hyphomicrobiales bacterium]